MKNKNGFTMIELIVTLGLLALMAIVVSTSFSGTKDKEAKSILLKNYKKAEDAACNYVEQLNFNLNGQTRDDCKDNANGCSIPISSIIEQGLLDGDTKADIYGENFNSYGDTMHILVKWEVNGNYKEKKCVCIVNGNNCSNLDQN